MNAEVILQRLECVRRNGIGWMALCSAHADKENLPTNRRTQREDLPNALRKPSVPLWESSVRAYSSRSSLLTRNQLQPKRIHPKFQQLVRPQRVHEHVPRGLPNKTGKHRRTFFRHRSLRVRSPPHAGRHIDELRERGRHL